MTNEATLRFIEQHRTDDVRRLALKGAKNPDVDLPFALRQIQGWQTARKKLPTWAEQEAVVFPPHINMEQCSSEATAQYKSDVISARSIGDFSARDTVLFDLTGGFGVDFSFMSRRFCHAVYVERDLALCSIARHNFQVFGLSHVQVVGGDGVELLHGLPEVWRRGTEGGRSDAPYTAIYLDPSRRDIHGQKVSGIEDCTPDVLQLRDELMRKADVVMVKLSPMLDWHAAIRALSHGKVVGEGCEVHIVSVNNECKELLLVLTHGLHSLRVVCVNDDSRFCYSPGCEVSTHVLSAVMQARLDALSASSALPSAGGEVVLLVPNASIMKAGCFGAIAATYGVEMLAPNSHLFIAPGKVDGFPGRQFRVMGISTMNKKELKQKLGGIKQANISARNFPLSAEDIRKQLKLKDGSSVYMFATTMHEQHLIFICEKIR